MHDVDLHRLARQELRVATAWYRARSEQACGRFRRAINDAVDGIAADPHVHAMLIAPYRCARVRRFPYLLIFETRPDNRVLIVAVAHTGRRPGYWRRRK